MSGRPSACFKLAMSAGSRFFRSSAAIMRACAAPRGRRTAAAGRAHLGQPHRLQAHLLDVIKPGARAGASTTLSARNAELDLPRDLVRRPRHRAAPARRPLSRHPGDQPLEAGMVLGIEPLIYETGFGFGMQNKDMVLVTGRLRTAVGLCRHGPADHRGVKLRVAASLTRHRVGATATSCNSEACGYRLRRFINQGCAKRIGTLPSRGGEAPPAPKRGDMARRAANPRSKGEVRPPCRTTANPSTQPRSLPCGLK